MVNGAVRSGSPADRLLPEGRLAGPMPWIVAIMIFLTILACAMGIALREGAATMAEAVSHRATVQIIEPDSRKREAALAQAVRMLRGTPGISAISVVPQETLQTQLEPWLGADIGASDIPIPALIDIDIAAEGDAADHVQSVVVQAIQRISAGARVEPHAVYLRPVANLVQVISAIAFAIVALTAIATSFVVVLAARGSHAIHRNTIDVMHMLGATDAQVTRLFQRRIARDVGFGAIIGLSAAVLVVLLIGRSVDLIAVGMLQTLSMPWWSWVVLGVIPLMFVALAWVAARLTLRRALSRTL